MSKQISPFAKVTGVNGNIVTIEHPHGHLMKNEVAYVHVGDEALKAEVLRIRGKTADLQVYEETAGVQVGDKVELTNELLSAELGPGLLGKVYDGLQNPLHSVAGSHGFFLPRGKYLDALDNVHKWAFNPLVRSGEKVIASQPIGTVQEGRFTHKIMVPFNLKGEAEITWIQGGSFSIDEPIARIRDQKGHEEVITLKQKWPVRIPIPEKLIEKRIAERKFPDEPLVTTLRLIDTFFPIAKGGTACIPGPFGAGKTVLQSLISRYSSADIVIVVACGERAGEVVETIETFAEMKDPKGEGTLMERTIVICNTSSMPVAAREASIYMGVTLAEYYRQMGYDTLVLADSTSRWAQAMRETSGRLEEIPGEEAFPAYLDSAIKNIYERAGVVETFDKQKGSLTLIGTVSPAGGNFEEPVTQSTLSTVKTFLGLSYARAYKRYYPAIDPLISWSRYSLQLKDYFDEHIDPNWTNSIEQVREILVKAEGIEQMMQVTGEEGITENDFVLFQKAKMLDLVYLQQDAFDPVDVSVDLKRQQENFLLLKKIVDTDFEFNEKSDASQFFTRMTGIFKNMNYSVYNSGEYNKHLNEINKMIEAY
ncbi:V-type ATP synthase subunit A [Thiomicrorhabdus indica]|uniref:V-type ATP synthase subunit A n=1 Tax=Thiomicrorhabdus indica TaxID=2267253 RepID=UPI00102E03F8|nr:V-type ATP synthase subunit A [Thiomicrorhabdus indica]